MLEIVKKLMSCKWCNEFLIDPVFLPCGETICAKHEPYFKYSIEENSKEESNDGYSNQICKLCDEYPR